ncbi:MAG: endonuclease Q family protein, partial [Desulfosalsimonas sp.]
MRYIADLHIHSRFSRATAKNLDFPHLYMAARQKGISVVATGDFTHPGWLGEIKEYLEPAEPGLFRLKPEWEKDCENRISVAGSHPVRFMLCTEISNIYKKGGVTRKIHHLVFFHGITQVEKFNARLSNIGNLKSDGRPILGLDSKNLLEIVLETHESGFLIPAHIWTPWFSLFGSKSGFDSVAECFDELSDHIFAVETGLSSDPPMNWRVKDLDNRTLVSNSDAHSPANLGREANLFDTELSYDAMRHAMESGDPEKFLGTIEFFPQEGKYHQDGHRKCGINLHPKQTIEKGGICPVCGSPVTVGTLYRVEQLAGRKEGEKPEKTHPFYSLIPLAEILSELMSVGPKSKKVTNAWQDVISRTGPELPVLLDMPVEKIRDSGNPLLAEAIRRMRRGEVHCQPGYDGAYGRITIFTKEERDRITGQKDLFVNSDNSGDT